MSKNRTHRILNFYPPLNAIIAPRTIRCDNYHSMKEVYIFEFRGGHLLTPYEYILFQGLLKNRTHRILNFYPPLNAIITPRTIRCNNYHSMKEVYIFEFRGGHLLTPYDSIFRIFLQIAQRILLTESTNSTLL